MAGRRKVRDPRGVESGKAGGLAHFAREIEVRGAGHALNRDQVGQPRIGIDMPAHHVEEIDLAAVLQPLRNRDPVLVGQPAFQHLIAGIADPDDEVRAHPPTDRVEHIESEAQPVVETAAIGRVQLVGQRRPELVHQVAIGLQLDPIHTACLHPLGGVGIVLDNPRDVPVFHLLGEGAVGAFALVAGGDDRQPVSLVPAGPAAQVGQLDHHRRALFVDRIGQFAGPFHHLVLPGEDVVEHRRAIERDCG